MTFQEANDHRWFRRLLRFGNIAAWVLMVGIIVALAAGYRQQQDAITHGRKVDRQLAALIRKNQRQAERLRRVALQTKQGGCTLRADLITRAQGTLEFLRTHPEGIAGVPADVLRTNAVNQLRTAHTLDSLGCQKEG